MISQNAYIHGKIKKKIFINEKLFGALLRSRLDIDFYEIISAGYQKT